MSQLTGGSSSSVPGNWRRRRGDRERGIPERCVCGEKAIIKTSGTAKNPGRLFYCCPFGSEQDKFHLFTWVDERIVEEVEDLKSIASDVKGEIDLLRGELDGFGKQLQRIKLISSNNRGCCSIL